MAALSTGFVADRRRLARGMRARPRHDDLIGIRIDDKVGVVSDHDDLALALGLDEKVHELVENRLGIKTLFGLVDN